MNKRPGTHFAWLSVAAALITIALKTGAYFLTGSVGLLSDAMESGINLAGAVMALSMLIIASRPADKDHNYGHGKAEYFSSSVEGLLIIVAAVFIAVAAIKRLIDPRPIEQIGAGMIVSLIASLINLYTALVLKKAGKENHSITLEADAKHLMTDVWTSAGVLAGIGLVVITGWERLDPVIAILVAANITWTGYSIIKKSVAGLMDQALSDEEQQILHKILEKYREQGIEFHAFLTREAGYSQFASFHVLVPGDWTVLEGHRLLEKIETDIKSAMPRLQLSTHLEALEDPASFDDTGLNGAN